MLWLQKSSKGMNLKFMRDTILDELKFWLKNEWIGVELADPSGKYVQFSNNDQALSYYTNDYLKWREFLVTQCSRLICPPGSFKIFGKVPNSKTKWDLEYGYQCIKCPNGTVKDFYGDGTFSEKEIHQL